MRLIDADALIADVKENNQTNFDKQDWTSRNVCTLLIGAPTIDAAHQFFPVDEEPEEISIRRWIPVTERLPGIDDGDWVLGVVNGFAYGIVYKNAIVTVEYYENSGCWSLHDLDAKVTVTHWMPLPEPPEEVTQDD